MMLLLIVSAFSADVKVHFYCAAADDKHRLLRSPAWTTRVICQEIALFSTHDW